MSLSSPRRRFYKNLLAATLAACSLLQLSAAQAQTDDAARRLTRTAAGARDDRRPVEARH